MNRARVTAWTRRQVIFNAVCVLFLWLPSSILTARTPERVLYIRADFADVPMGISDALWLQRFQRIDADAEAYWTFNSYGGITEFQSSFTEVFTLGNSMLSQFNNGANVFGISSAMRSAAAQAGWNVNQFDQVVLSFPGLPAFPAGALGTPGTVWLPGANPFGPGLIHEFGHALRGGVGHANSVEGGATTFPGVHREGADGLFMMGSEDARLAPINLPMRSKLGFLDSQLVSVVDSFDIHRIHAFDREDISGDVALNRNLATVFRYRSRNYWISFAPGLANTWADFNGQGLAEGIIVQELQGDITRILDFTPNSQGGSNQDHIDTRDGALVVGQSFTFPSSELTLAPLRTGFSADGVPWIDVAVSFEILGDFNADSLIDQNDFHILATNLLADVSDLTVEQSLALGDLDGDLRIDFDDYLAFGLFYDQANGQGAFAALSRAVPEPASLALAALLGVSFWTCSRSKRNLRGVCFVVGALSFSTHANAVPIADWAIDPLIPGSGILSGATTASPTIGDGSTNSADAISYFGRFSSQSLNLGEQLVLTGTATFTGASTSNAQFSFGLFDSNGSAATDSTNWLGFMHVNSSGGGDGRLVSKNPANAPFSSLSGGSANDLRLLAEPNGNDFDDDTYHFEMVVSRSNPNSLVIDSSLVSATDPSGYAHQFSQVEAFSPTSLTFTYDRVGFLNGGRINAEQTAFSDVNVIVRDIPAVNLVVDTTDGTASIVNNLPVAVALNYYQIESGSQAVPGSSLDVNGWTSLDAQEGDDPPGTGWVASAASSQRSLVESNLLGSLALNPAEHALLGSPFNSETGLDDLTFSYSTPGVFELFQGVVQYVDDDGITSGSDVPGDYDGDGSVTFADLAEWESSYGQTAPSGTGADGDQSGLIDGGDFLLWQRSIDASAIVVSSVAYEHIPEPTSLGLVVAGWLAAFSKRWRSNRFSTSNHLKPIFNAYTGVSDVEAALPTRNSDGVASRNADACLRGIEPRPRTSILKASY